MACTHQALESSFVVSDCMEDLTCWCTGSIEVHPCQLTHTVVKHELLAASLTCWEAHGASRVGHRSEPKPSQPQPTHQQNTTHNSQRKAHNSKTHKHTHACTHMHTQPRREAETWMILSRRWTRELAALKRPRTQESRKVRQP